MGLFNNYDEIDSAKSTLGGILDQSQATSAANKRLYDEYMAKMNGTYGQNDGKYDDAVSRLAEAIDNREDFSYQGDVSDFMDPARDQRVSAAMNAIENSSAAGGNRFSSSFLDKVAAKQQALASEEWRDAYNRLMADRQQQLQEWNSGQNKINNLATMTGVYGSERDKLTDALGNYFSNVANQNNADLEMQSDIATARANLEAQKKDNTLDFVGGLLGSAAKIFGGI